MKITKYITLVLFCSLSVSSFAQSSDEPWLKRNWNNMIARFNIYFNADQKMQTAVNTLAEKQKDDFNGIIDIYPYGTEKDAKGMKNSMEETMKKASKVIQTKPNSKWVDDAYFIIGQTQFYSGDYYAAIETFQFVNNSFTDPNMKAMSQLWLMKSYIQQGKLDDAEAIYGLLKKLDSPNPEFSTHLNLSAGDLLVKQGKEGIASELLSNGLPKLRDRTLKYRTNFVLGQLYLKAKKYKKANTHFVKVLRMNAPYEYVFQSNLGMAKSSAENGGQGAQRTVKYLKRMLNDDKNIEYYDQIYFELAKLEFGSGNEKEGLSFMKQSASSSGKNTVQQTKTYLFLADYYFENRDYTSAQAYYDSAVSVIPEKYPDGEKIQAKHSVLSKLIENIETIKTQDSLIALSQLDREVLDKRINRIIEEEAERERIAKEEAELKKEQDRMNALTGGRQPARATVSSGSTWYFYDVAAVARGENEFRRTWGNRKLTDYWRFINKSLMEKTFTSEQKEDDQEEEENIDPDTYIGSEDDEQEELLKDVDAEKRKYYANIPFSPTAKLVANKKIQQAYMGNGKIYFDDLKEFQTSEDNLNTLLAKYPNTSFKPEAIFYLAKASAELGNETKAQQYARQIADEFPETPFNSVLNGKEIEEDNSEQAVQVLYEKMYVAFENEDFTETQNIKKQIDREYPGNALQAKIDYLYALLTGKTKGKDAYIEELEIIRENYAGTLIGEKAAYSLRLLQGEAEVESSIYDNETEGIYYYVITGKSTKGNEVEIQLGNYNNQFFSGQKLITKGLVFGDKQLYYIKQFSSKSQALSYHNEMKSNTVFLQNTGITEFEYYPITEANFKTLVKTKKEKEYLSFFRKKYK